MPKIVRLTTVPLSLKLLLKHQMLYLSQAGFEVVVVSSEGKEWHDVLRSEKDIRKEVVPFTRKITPIKDLYCIWLLYRLFRKEKPDIVHSHTPKAGLLGMIAAWMAGVPVRIHTLAGLPYVSRPDKQKKLLAAMEKLTYRFAVEVWPNALSLKDAILKEKLVGEDKVRIIGNGSSNGVDLSVFNRANLQENHLVAATMRLSPGEDEFLILAVGRMVKDKGIANLVEAFVQSKIVNRSRLVLVGDFEQELDPLEIRTINQIKDHPRIVHIPWTDHVPYYLALCDVLVHASYREGFPNVLLEAGAMCCPVICSDIAGNRELAVHMKTALVYPLKQVAALKEALEFAFVKREVMQGFAERMYARVEKDFDRKNLHAEILNAYNRLLDRK
ncbi:Glycosyltransferase involved in cell wall bisynthesis [Cyclobacterium lianum]|uniref:Glycosyltransferase involved in cell wall bisynthesis n=1 Tax=Cyclobacterium lianum TaxID=388280 RepID=A0A1M7MRV3_9BACT|nr:glycosyltransferase family 4 protein [Cyclobacterium lianum]SHM93282.1 Glycosyltransferase involved in cell wall bisynthesis [Cyclobacterium lianum]